MQALKALIAASALSTFAQSPPAAFDAAKASDADLATYRIPPRPSDSKRLAKWNRIVSHAKQYIEPVLTEYPDIHPGAYQAGGNWSGPVYGNGAASYNSTTSIAWVEAEWIVPPAVPPQSDPSCAAANYSAINWVGIDGDGYFSPDIDALWQAGTMGIAYKGTCEQVYFFFMAFWPGATGGPSNLPVTVGDVVFVYLSSTGATSGEVFLLNETTGKYTTLSANAPTSGCVVSTKAAPCALVGSSAEWIMEEVMLGGSITSFADYVLDYWSTAYAGDFAGDIFTAADAQWLNYGSQPMSCGTNCTSWGAVASSPVVLAPWEDMILFQSQAFPGQFCGDPVKCPW